MEQKWLAIKWDYQLRKAKDDSLARAFFFFYHNLTNGLSKNVQLKRKDV